MSKVAQRQIAICYLLLKGEHWIPVSPDRRLTAVDRSSPDGPVIMAELIAEVEGSRIAGWRKAASARGVVGINSRIVERRRAREERTIPSHLYASVLARAETQILDRLNGFNAVGVRLVPHPSDEIGI